MVSTMNTRRLVPDADCLMRSQLSMAALTAVSEPRLKSVPGTLLLMVAGMTHMTMQSSS